MWRDVARPRGIEPRFPPASVTIDGEAVCCDDDGVAVFEKLHSRTHDAEAFLYAFDLLELDGEDWRPQGALPNSD
jgi:ATP-dependent DNA ligase